MRTRAPHRAPSIVVKVVYTLVRGERVTTVPLSEAKTHLARLLADVERVGEGVTITRSGRPAAVLLSVEEYEGLLETLDILADAKLMASLRRGLRDAAAGRTVADGEVWR